ncbi:alkylated DNA repair alkB like 6 [Fusarium albosuccineum]|uniref:Alkylated DNA repair alkB like 6 n=1 Tax=Fusarium albosuccineum TaxID=1237068 RepID=A0A8H4LFJ8_9HYPO|nr:alkylated DNA repair alkB like 6 [Fusarium albosuccineum]
MESSPSFTNPTRDDAHHDFSLPPSLEHARITTLPQTAYYIPNFISEEEERVILDKVSSAPKPRWKQLTKRRLQTWPSDLVNNKLLDAPLPAWLENPVVSRLLSLPAHDSRPEHMFDKSPHQRPNHVLINEYPPGIGIMPHKLSTRQVMVPPCYVSLGASLCLNLHRSKDDGALDPVPAWRILQEPRSLLITTDQLYTDYLHGIADIGEDVDLTADTVANWELLRSPDAYASGRNVRQTRTSLTYRDVLQVSKVANKLGMFLKR